MCKILAWVAISNSPVSLYSMHLLPAVEVKMMAFPKKSYEDILNSLLCLGHLEGMGKSSIRGGNTSIEEREHLRLHKSQTNDIVLELVI